MNPRVFSPEQERAVIAEYQEGKSIKVIARDRGVSPAAVHGVLVRHDVPRRDGKPKLALTPQEDADIAERYRNGAALSQLAAQFDCSRITIRHALARQGVEPRPRGSKLREFSAEEVADVAARWEAGESQTAIGQSLGISQAQAGRLLALHGYEKEHRRPRGEKHGAWKGGRVLLEGYWQIRVQPDDLIGMAMRGTNGYVAEHRLVMAHALGRTLNKHETVHHVNGDRTDNRLENLQLRQGRHGKGAAFCCLDCGSKNVVSVELN